MERFLRVLGESMKSVGTYITKYRKVSKVMKPVQGDLKIFESPFFYFGDSV